MLIIHDDVVLCLEGKCGVRLGRGAKEKLTCDLTGTRSGGPRSYTYARSENSFGVSLIKKGFVQSVNWPESRAPVRCPATALYT